MIDAIICAPPFGESWYLSTTVSMYNILGRNMGPSLLVYLVEISPPLVSVVIAVPPVIFPGLRGKKTRMLQTLITISIEVST